MELLHLRVALDRFDGVLDRCSGSPVVISCADADTVIALATLAGRTDHAVGIWLHVDEGYPAQMAARDVATLSHLLHITHVVIASDTMSAPHADVVRALLNDDAVNFTNDVATLRGAYNRPAPPQPLTVWSYANGAVTNATTTLRAHSSTSDALGELTVFA